MTRILSIVGTRPEIIKTKAFWEAAKGRADLEFLVARSGQHLDATMSGVFFEQLGMHWVGDAQPLNRETPGTILGSLVDACLRAIDEFKPDIVMSNTDTDSALASAMAAAKRRVPVAHIEAGLRCSARLNPEEVNRRLSDHLATWLFPHIKEAHASLMQEGFDPDMVHLFGDITLDALQLVMRDHGIEAAAGGYDLMTMHRQENADNPKRLAAILGAVADGGFPTVFLVHPRTYDNLGRWGLWDVVRNTRIEIQRQQDYVETLRLLAGCRKVISDSGGLRREAYMVDKPVISLVDFIWVQSMVDLGFEFIADADPARLTWAIREFDPPGPRPPLFGDGRAGCRILQYLTTASVS